MQVTSFKLQVTSYKLQKKATKLVALSDASLRSLSDHQKTIEARESGCLSLASCLFHLFLSLPTPCSAYFYPLSLILSLNFSYFKATADSSAPATSLLRNASLFTTAVINV